jgi:ATPase family associated with various cellular activities (AAA)
MLDITEAIANNSPLDELLPLLQRLDTLLEQAVAATQATYGTEAVTDRYRGLHVNPEDAEQLLQRKPAEPAFQLNSKFTTAPIDRAIEKGSRLARLIELFGLSAFDLDVIAIALAPELDRRYDRLYAYLQDDVRCQRPSVDLALNLLCPNAAEKLAKRIHFAPEAPLIRHNLIHLVTDTHPSKPTLLARELHLDEQVVRFLLAQPGLDPQLHPFCQLIQPTASLTQLPLAAELQHGLQTLVTQSRQKRQPLRLYFQGVDRPSQRRTAEAIAQEAIAPLLVVDLARLCDPSHNTPANTTHIESLLQRVFREAQFQDAIAYLDKVDTWDAQPIWHQCLISAMAEHPGIAIAAGTQPWNPGDSPSISILTLPFSLPDFALRRDCWQTHLTAANIAIADPDLNALVDRFRLTPSQIANAVQNACDTARWQAAQRPGIPGTPPSPPTLEDLFAAARAQSGRDLATLTRKVEPNVGWDDLVLPVAQQTQLRELCDRAKYRHFVHQTWGFEDKLSLGKGLNVLFAGPPGTGKTMAAEAIARELQLDLYKIDLSQIVSKYIGETEKNLNRIFTAAAASNAILLFDEADALFGKRSEVRDAHDRYANLEISYLLQKMEEYEGVAILTTNLRSNMDEAFVRRLGFIVEFSLPNPKHRRQIWQKIWPETTPCSPDLDLDFIARRFELTGANIRNIALASAYFAANEGGVVSMMHLIRALRREYQKMGKILMEEEFEKYGEFR